jgi:hypothetical protein
MTTLRQIHHCVAALAEYGHRLPREEQFAWRVVAGQLQRLSGQELACDLPWEVPAGYAEAVRALRGELASAATSPAAWPAAAPNRWTWTIHQPPASRGDRPTAQPHPHNRRSVVSASCRPGSDAERPGEPGGQRRPVQQVGQDSQLPPIWAAVSAPERWAGGRVGLQLVGTSAAISACGPVGSAIDLTLCQRLP